MPLDVVVERGSKGQNVKSEMGFSAHLRQELVWIGGQFCMQFQIIGGSVN